MTKINKSKIEKNSISDSENEIEIVKNTEELTEEPIEEIKQNTEPINIKEIIKKPRTQKQIDATNNMRSKLTEKRDIVKQEKDEFKKQVKIKIKKDKIQKKVISKLREIIDEDESEDEEIEYKKPIKKIIVKEPLRNLIKFF